MLKVYKYNNVYYCNWKLSPYYCGSDILESPDQKIVKIKLPITPTPTQFVIGSFKLNVTINSPINTIINNISIY
jgi:hypothetical protein